MYLHRLRLYVCSFSTYFRRCAFNLGDTHHRRLAQMITEERSAGSEAFIQYLKKNNMRGVASKLKQYYKAAEAASASSRPGTTHLTVSVCVQWKQIIVDICVISHSQFYSCPRPSKMSICYNSWPCVRGVFPLLFR